MGIWSSLVVIAQCTDRRERRHTPQQSLAQNTAPSAKAKAVIPTSFGQ